MMPCPDDLLVRVLRGSLTPGERAQLDSHIEHCATCRTVLAVTSDFDAVLDARTGDDEVATRIAARLTKKRRRPARPAALLLVALVLGSAVATAATQPALRRTLQSLWTAPTQNEAHSTYQEPDVRPQSKKSVQTPVMPSPALSEPPAPPPATSLPTDQAASATPTPLPPSTSNNPTLAPPVDGSAPALFASANKHRRAGEISAAQADYLKLQQRFPTSNEALVSHVSVGRMLSKGAPAQALQHFNRYLSQTQHTTLAAEALYGKATTLAALGRALEEKKAWKQLLDRFPSSVYTERAQAKLQGHP